uniref:Uncharacterized protein n=2 Tax=Opuntia streptacantha TaxID=393608 RepID=A0A7C8ZXA1_OPUST
MEYTGSMTRRLRNRSYQNKYRSQPQLSKAMSRYTQSTLSPQMTPSLLLTLFLRILKLWLEFMITRTAKLPVKTSSMSRLEVHHATWMLRRSLVCRPRLRSNWFNVPFNDGKCDNCFMCKFWYGSVTRA